MTDIATDEPFREAQPEVPPFEDDSVEELVQLRNFRMLRSSLKRADSGGEAPSTPVSFAVRDDRTAASDSLQFLLALASPSGLSCQPLPPLAARDSMGRQRPIVVVACCDWDLPAYLEDTAKKGRYYYPEMQGAHHVKRYSGSSCCCGKAALHVPGGVHWALPLPSC
eukprot:jgi/Botrbrau1/10333/Bobra.0321s0011.1